MDGEELKAARDRLQRKAWPKFYQMANNLVSALMATLEGGDSGSFDGEPDRSKIYAPLSESNIVGSLVGEKVYEHSIFANNPGEWWKYKGEKVHRPVLDIDLPIWAHESTTPGHWHLIIDKEMPETAYFNLLDAMYEAGILEKGFVDAAKSRGASWIRVPWVNKKKEK